MNFSTKVVSIIVVVLVCIAFTQIDFSPNKKVEKTKSKEQLKPIVEVASHTTGLATFVAAVKTAGLTQKLNKEGPYTVFAPSDKAFAALPKDVFANLMTPEYQDTLKKLLMNHVVAGKIEASDLKDGQVLTTLGGKKITIAIGDDAVMANDAELIKTNIETLNGTIYMIDQVLMPAEKTT